MSNKSSDNRTDTRKWSTCFFRKDIFRGFCLIWSYLVGLSRIQSDLVGLSLIRSLWSKSVGFGRSQSDLVGVSRIWSECLGVSRIWSNLVGFGPIWSNLVEFGRIRSNLVRVASGSGRGPNFTRLLLFNQSYKLSCSCSCSFHSQ